MIVFGMILLFAGQSYPQGVVYFSENETDLSGNRVPFYPGGTIIGDIRSNDMFAFANPLPVINGRIITSAEKVQLEDGLAVDSLQLPTAPLVNLPMLGSMANISDKIRGNAEPRIFTDDGKLMVRLLFKGDRGCEVWKWPRGSDPDKYARLDQTVAGSSVTTIWIDGECEVQGQVSGKVTVGAAGDIYIRDNIQYVGSNAYNGAFGEDYQTQSKMKHALGLVSEKNIIIQNTMQNGRMGGFRYFPNDINHHSVNINAALWALGGSVMFEQTNDSTELYQGPSPDERGTIYITGQICQVRPFPLHNDNHGGTGYKLRLVYDHRFWSSPPPNIEDHNYPILLIGYYDHESVSCGRYTRVASHCNIGSIYCYGDTLTFNGPYTLEVREKAIFRGYGSSSNPNSALYIQYPYWKPGVPKAKIICWNAGAEIEFHNVTVGPGVELYITAMEPLFTNSEAKDNTTFICQNITLDGCKFTNLNLNCWEDAVVQRNLIRGTLTIDNLPDNCLIHNNTILTGGSDGVVVKSYKKIDIRNNIITGAKRALVDSYKRKGITLGYNCLWDCKETDVGISDMGAGNVYADPRFYDARNDIYELAVGSSCYNAGDPSSPKDPDGTLADIGAYYCAQTSVEDDPVVRLVPSQTVVTVSPNPFNSITQISYTVPRQGIVSVRVYDINGRLVATLMDGIASFGSHTVVWNASGISAGVYFVRLASGDRVWTVKTAHVK